MSTFAVDLPNIPDDHLELSLVRKVLQEALAAYCLDLASTSYHAALNAPGLMKDINERLFLAQQIKSWSSIRKT